MKTQDQLNQDYDRIMIDFKQKAFIEASLKHEYDLEKFVIHSYKAFANHFNSEYKHIYLKPLCELLDKHPAISDKKQTFSTVSKSLPTTFWNTDLGEETVLKQARIAIENLFVLPLTDERKLFFSKKPQQEDFSTIKELNNTDKIKIQETYSEFVDSFINSSVLPDHLKYRCFDLLIRDLSFIANESTLNNTLVNFTQDSLFIKDVLSSVKLHTPHGNQQLEYAFDSIFKTKSNFKP